MKLIPRFVLKDTCTLPLLSDAEVPLRHPPHANFRPRMGTPGAKELAPVRHTPFLLALLFAITAMYEVSAQPTRAQAPSTAISKSVTFTSTASHRAVPAVHTLAHTMAFIETNTPVNKPLSATVHYPNGDISYMATVSAFAAKGCSTDLSLQVHWGDAVLNRQPHIDLNKLDPRDVEIITSDVYRKHIVSSQGGEDVVSVTSPVDYFVGVPEEIGLPDGHTTNDFQIFAITDDRAKAEGLAEAYIYAIAACGDTLGAVHKPGHPSAVSPSVHDIERQSLIALQAHEKEAEAETDRDAETYGTQAKVAQEKAATEKAAREAAIAQAQQALQATQAGQAEELQLWQAKVNELTEQVRIAEQDAAAKEQLVGQADQLKQQADSTTDVSSANSGSMGAAGVLLGSLGSLWGSHTAKKNRDAAQKARAHANELRAELDAMGASQPPPVTGSGLPPITPADTSNPIQDALNRGLNNINAYAQDVALKAQQSSERQPSSAADTRDGGGQSADDLAQHCKGHHPDPKARCDAALGDGAAWAAYCYCP